MLQFSYAGLVVILLLAGCASGTVQFAPTEPPPDLSPTAYTHPSGAFQAVLPRTWTLMEQQGAGFAGAAFAAPGEEQPSLLFLVLNTGADLDTAAFGEIINQYQTQARPDLDRYSEQNRQAMGDGSWRVTGLRQTPIGATEQVNTFIERDGALLGIVDVVLPPDENPARMAELGRIVNSFEINGESALAPASLTALTGASATGLSVLHVTTWTTPTGVFFVTGEVANYGASPVSGVPIQAILRTADGLSAAEAADTVMGYGIAPGGFAPFSLRFGQGQPSVAVEFELVLGGDAWAAGLSEAEPLVFVGPEALTWTDDSTRGDGGSLIVRGTVTNTSEAAVRFPRAVVTVFDHDQRVVAAGWTDVGPDQLAPGETAEFQVVVPEIGGEPANYIVSVQGLGSSSGVS